MKPEDVIWIIVVIVFFVGPILKSIFQAVTGTGAGGQKQRSQEEIKEYLERMRQGKQQQQAQKAAYHSPATKPQPQPESFDDWYSSKMREQKHKAQPVAVAEPKQSLKQRKKLESSLAKESEAPKFTTHIESNTSFQDAILAGADVQVKEPLDTGGVGAILDTESEDKSQPVAANANGLQLLVFNNKLFSDAQKAIVLSEIIRKPKALHNENFQLTNF